MGGVDTIPVDISADRSDSGMFSASEEEKTHNNKSKKSIKPIPMARDDSDSDMLGNDRDSEPEQIQQVK